MDTLPTELLFVILATLILLSGFFSSSETGMLSLNRYRLRHLANQRHAGAMRASLLLERPDRLISVILIGNNLVNIFATIVAAEIAKRFFGDWAWGTIFLMPFVLTLVLLIFAEVTPKSIAAVYPEKIAFPASIVLRPLLLVLHPFVWLINSVSIAISRCFGLDPSQANLTDDLHPEELRTVVDESGQLLSNQHQSMMLNVLDLEKSTVEDILVPRSDIVGLDLSLGHAAVMETIRSTEYTMLPVFEGNINEVVGVLHMRNIAKCLESTQPQDLINTICQQLTTPYFIPESTPLSKQLLNFQKQKKRMALVVDEYGDIQGMVTLVDLLEEIVGDFSTDISEDLIEPITLVENGWFKIDASESIRDINKELGWKLPTDGPKTLNGLMTEFLEHIPDAIVSFQIDNYRFELKELGDNKITLALAKELEKNTDDNRV